MKGDSAAIKTDWDTGLGQLLDMMNYREADYAITVSESYERLVRSFPSYVTNKLQLTFYIIREDGKVDSVR